MNIEWLPRALKYREAQLGNIAAVNLRSAIDQGDLLEHHIDLLAHDPKRGCIGRMCRTRELAVAQTSFVVIYRELTRLQRIEILRVLHCARQSAEHEQLKILR